ncbi:hypothetical protein [Salinicola peritrichatus]|uniref:hypothetical protein n=1 Tax=Salinicola peritrichatus TaxID=1267424 RepID=UPI000DA23427|nr:hypothetical protein [Salinicola peritrichatus]
MSIRRAPRPESNFYLLDKRISEDERLSWAARGMLIFLLGKPDHWIVSVANLINETAGSSKKSGRDAVYGTLKELERAGYLTREKARADGGEFGGVDYVVHESPLTEKPHTANPDTVKPHTANPDTVKPDTANPTQVSIEGVVSNETPARNETSLASGDAKRAKKNTQLPDDFQPNDTNRRIAAERGVNLEDELANFKDYHGAKGSKFKDWNLALNTWLRRARGTKVPGNVHPFPGRPRPQHSNLDQATSHGLTPRADGTYSL